VSSDGAMTDAAGARCRCAAIDIDHCACAAAAAATHAQWPGCHGGKGRPLHWRVWTAERRIIKALTSRVSAAFRTIGNAQLVVHRLADHGDCS